MVAGFEEGFEFSDGGVDDQVVGKFGLVKEGG